MSHKFSKRVWEHHYETLSEKLVMLALAQHTNDAGYCWPGQQRVADMCGISERHVPRVLHKLERRGDLIVAVRGRGRCYLLTLGQTNQELCAAIEKHLHMSPGEAAEICRQMPIPDTVSGMGERSSDAVTARHLTSGATTPDIRCVTPDVRCVTPDVTPGELLEHVNKQQQNSSSSYLQAGGNGDGSHLGDAGEAAVQTLRETGMPVTSRKGKGAREAVLAAIAGGWSEAETLAEVKGWLAYARSTRGATIDHAGFFTAARIRKGIRPPSEAAAPESLSRDEKAWAYVEQVLEERGLRT